MFAVIQVAGKQHKVTPGQSVVIGKLEGNVGDVIDVSDVLLIDDNGKVTVGTPFVSGAKVKVKIVEQGKGEKIEGRRYKSKVRHRRNFGFRPRQTTLEIVSIA